MPDPIATVFHVTDMHLFVDAEGHLREQPLWLARQMARLTRKVPVPSARDLLAGTMWHDAEALAALRDELPELARAERDTAPEAPVLVLQTGDVEAVGSAAPAALEGYEAFPSYEFVHRRMRDAGDWEWLDVHGNHDTWPGIYPPMRWRHRAVNRKRIATVPGLEGPWPGEPAVLTGPAGIPVVVARVNTISRTALEETLASGRVTDHPPGHGGSVIDGLRAAFAGWRGEPAIRIAVMHHPPHVFDAKLSEELTTGRLVGGDELARCLSELRVQLVIAGHRHKLNPGAGVTSPAPSPGGPPLADPTVQLVGQSATQDSVEPGDAESGRVPSRSFCRYRLLTDGAGFAVERTVFGYSETAGDFSRATTATLFAGLPLE